MLRMTRRWVANRLEKDDLRHFLQGDVDEATRQVRELGTWGGEPEIAALASVFGVAIVVHDRRHGTQHRVAPLGTPTNEGEGGTREIHVDYNGVHYDPHT